MVTTSFYLGIKAHCGHTQPHSAVVPEHAAGFRWMCLFPFHSPNVCALLKNAKPALASVAQWSEHQPAHQRAMGLIPSLTGFSSHPPSSLLPTPLKKKINRKRSSGEINKNKNAKPHLAHTNLSCNKLHPLDFSLS